MVGEHRMTQPPQELPAVDQDSSDEVALLLGDARARAQAIIDESIERAQDLLRSQPSSQALERIRRTVADIAVDVRGIHSRLDDIEALIRGGGVTYRSPAVAAPPVHYAPQPESVVPLHQAPPPPSYPPAPPPVAPPPYREPEPASYAPPAPAHQPEPEPQVIAPPPTPAPEPPVAYTPTAPVESPAPAEETAPPSAIPPPRPAPPLSPAQEPTPPPVVSAAPPAPVPVPPAPVAAPAPTPTAPTPPPPASDARAGFDPADGSVALRIAPVAGFQGLMRVQDALARCRGVREVGVEAYAQGEARLRLQLSNHLDGEHLALSLGEILGRNARVAAESIADRSIQLALE
jgi:hypothetical protein